MAKSEKSPWWWSSAVKVALAMIAIFGAAAVSVYIRTSNNLVEKAKDANVAQGNTVNGALQQFLGGSNNVSTYISNTTNYGPTNAATRDDLIEAFAPVERGIAGLSPKRQPIATWQISAVVEVDEDGLPKHSRDTLHGTPMDAVLFGRNGEIIFSAEAQSPIQRLAGATSSVWRVANMKVSSPVIGQPVSAITNAVVAGVKGMHPGATLLSGHIECVVNNSIRFEIPFHRQILNPIGAAASTNLTQLHDAIQ